MVGAIAALLLIGISDPLDGPGRSTPKGRATESTPLTSPAPATVPTPAQITASTANNPLSPRARGTNANTGDVFFATLAGLETLPIKGRALKTGYTREAFGPPWTDDVNLEGGHNGCHTRNEILRRDLIEITIKARSNGCTVLSSALIDPYTDKTIPVRGACTSTATQIDHLVALADAWQKSVQQLDQQTRQDFANDPRSLQATDGAVNKQKRRGPRRDMVAALAPSPLVLDPGPGSSAGVVYPGAFCTPPAQRESRQPVSPSFNVGRESEQIYGQILEQGSE